MKYPSRYSNDKFVSAAQYITEMICEKKAKMDKQDLHYRFWTNKKWSAFFRNQIATANKLIKEYGEKPVIRAMNNPKTERIYSLRAPHLIPIIEQEAKLLEEENDVLTKKFERKEDVSHRQTINLKKNILSKLEDIENGS
jgi:hypothetical protein